MYGFKIIVEGDYACFTRPELKVERVSYDVPTPSALEGLLKSLYWKPAIRYRIDKVVVYNPVKFANIRRNEIKDVVSYNKVKAQMKGKGGDLSVYASESRTQRSAMVLKDVKYGIEFHFELTNVRNEEEADGNKKHYNIIKRRLESGQWFRTPCLGCREFSVKRLEMVDDLREEEVSQELKGDIDIGYMLYALKFKDGGIPINNNWETPVFSDCADAVYYRPHMIDGVIDVRKYAEAVRC